MSSKKVTNARGFQFELGQRSQAQIEFLRITTGATTSIEVVRRAIILYNEIVRIREDGGLLMSVRKHEGKEERVVLIVV